MQSVRMIGNDLEDPAKQRPGVVELLVLLQHDREADRLVERQLARLGV
jgi:hypothetical protein